MEPDSSALLRAAPSCAHQRSARATGQAAGTTRVSDRRLAGALRPRLARARPRTPIRSIRAGRAATPSTSASPTWRRVRRASAAARRLVTSGPHNDVARSAMMMRGSARRHELQRLASAGGQAECDPAARGDQRSRPRDAALALSLHAANLFGRSIRARRCRSIGAPSKPTAVKSCGHMDMWIVDHLGHTTMWPPSSVV